MENGNVFDEDIALFGPYEGDGAEGDYTLYALDSLERGEEYDVYDVWLEKQA